MKLNLNVFGEFLFTHCIHSLRSVELDQDADSRFYGDIGTIVLVWVTMLFGINSMSNVIEIVRGEHRLPVLSLANSKPAFEKVTCNCSYIISFTHYLLISGLASAETSFSTCGSS